MDEQADCWVAERRILRNITVSVLLARPHYSAPFFHHMEYTLQLARVSGDINKSNTNGEFVPLTLCLIVNAPTHFLLFRDFVMRGQQNAGYPTKEGETLLRDGAGRDLQQFL